MHLADQRRHHFELAVLRRVVRFWLPNDVNINMGSTPLDYFSFCVETEMSHMREVVPSKCRAVFLFGIRERLCCFNWGSEINSVRGLYYQFMGWPFSILLVIELASEGSLLQGCIMRCVDGWGVFVFMTTHSGWDGVQIKLACVPRKSKGEWVVEVCDQEEVCMVIWIWLVGSLSFE